MDFHAVFGQVFHAFEGASALLAQFHHRSGKFCGGQDRGIDNGFANLCDLALGVFRGVINAGNSAVFTLDVVDNVRRGSDQVEVERWVHVLRRSCLRGTRRGYRRG